MFGWRFVLGLRSGPRSSPDYVSGCRVREARPGVVILEARSRLLTPDKVIEVASDRVRMSSFVRYERRLGRGIWTLVAPVHHRTEPFLLGDAASRRA